MFPHFGQLGNRPSSGRECVKALPGYWSYDSLIDSSSETADQRVTLAKEGMFGSCATSSRRLMAFAALTATLCLESCSINKESLTVFLMLRGVILESEIC